MSDMLKNTVTHIDHKTEQIITNLGAVGGLVAELRVEFLREMHNMQSGFSQSIEPFLSRLDVIETAVEAGTNEIMLALTKPVTESVYEEPSKTKNIKVPEKSV